MAAPGGARRPQRGHRIIRSKITVPAAPRPARLVPRERLVELLATLVAEHQVVSVTATAGAGKTTAVIQALPRIGRRTAWLSVDTSEAAPGKLLTYLEASLAQVEPRVHDVVTSALAAQIPHHEAAGLLADALGDTDALLVIDELERLCDAPEALAVVGVFLRHAAPSLRTIAVSRRELALDVGPLAAGGQVAGVGEGCLAFTVEEAAEALHRIGADCTDAASAVKATGGWVTGVLFEVWRYADHVAGIGGEADPLYGYLSSEILAQLTPDERDFLVSTSLLDEVTVARAEALGHENAAHLMSRLRSAHLPMTWDSAGRAMRCHARFREYLLTCLQRRGQRAMAEARRALGELLMREGHDEEAVEQFLQAGAYELAGKAADNAIETVVERLDFAVAERWLAELHAHDVAFTPALALGELMLALALESYWRGTAVADRLADRGVREQLATTSSRAAAMMAWCYFHVGRIDDARAVLRQGKPGPATDAMRYCLTLADDDPGGELEAGWASGDPFDALVMRVHLYRGRLPLLTEQPSSPWAVRASEPWRISALRAMGRTQQALELYEAAAARSTGSAWLRAVAGVELLLDLGRPDEARVALGHGRTLVQRTGSVLHSLVIDVLAVKAALRGDRDLAAAERILARIEAHPALPGYRFVAEQAAMWAGYLALLRGADATARARLREAVCGMHRCGRMLELPTAAVYLAEAEWRAGNQESADRAADLALQAARVHGSHHVLLQALADFPAVLTRRLEAVTDAGSPWHELGRALAGMDVPIEVRSRAAVTLREFGTPSLLVNGVRVEPKITKSLELLAYLSTRPAHRASRAELLGALFDGRSDDSARSYLRQAVRRLGEVLPAGLRADRKGVVIPPEIDLLSDAARFEALVVQARRLRGEERRAVLTEALELADRGPYLDGVHSRWAEERQEQLHACAVDARLAAADCAFDAEDYLEARRLAEAVLVDDRFREEAWRLVMRIDSALGGDDEVLADYRRCVRALQEVGAAPSASTQRLLHSLRR